MKEVLIYETLDFSCRAVGYLELYLPTCLSNQYFVYFSKDLLLCKLSGLFSSFLFLAWQPEKEEMYPVRKVPSLVDLCVYKAIDNLRFLGDVGETDLHLLERILPHCTVDQLMHVEKSSEVRLDEFASYLTIWFLWYIC